MKRVENLFQLCNTLEMDLQKIDAYMVSENISSQEMTEVLARLMDEYRYEIDSFQHAHGRDPKPSELVLKSLPDLVALMLKRGLDPNFVFAKSNGFFDYMNLDAKVYIQNDCLCITDLETVHALPLSSLTCIRTVKKRISQAFV